MAERPRVVVIFTGGTIAMLPDPATGAAVPALRGRDVLDRVPGLADIAELEVVDWGLVPASHLRFAQLLEIGEHHPRGRASGPTSAASSSCRAPTSWRRPPSPGTSSTRPTHRSSWSGAMRSAGEPGYDGPRNLTDAVRVAGDARMRGQGVVVVMAGLVLPADDAIKTHSQALDAFAAPNDGPLGQVVDEQLVIERARGRRRVLPRVPDRAAEPVALVTAVVSTDGELHPCRRRGRRGRHRRRGHRCRATRTRTCCARPRRRWRAASRSC